MLFRFVWMAFYSVLSTHRIVHGARDFLFLFLHQGRVLGWEELGYTEFGTETQGTYAKERGVSSSST